MELDPILTPWAVAAIAAIIILMLPPGSGGAPA